jgi:hypothetical protein
LRHSDKKFFYYEQGKDDIYSESYAAVSVF